MIDSSNGTTGPKDRCGGINPTVPPELRRLRRLEWHRLFSFHVDQPAKIFGTKNPAPCLAQTISRPHPIHSSHTMAKSKGCRAGSKAASRWLTSVAAAIGSAATLVACFAQTVNCADEQGWQLVVPSTTALPSVEPPASFNRSVNNIRPMGTSQELSEALPNRLQTNKFYSNFLVSRTYYMLLCFNSAVVEVTREAYHHEFSGTRGPRYALGISSREALKISGLCMRGRLGVITLF